jgi:protein SCO1
MHTLVLRVGDLLSHALLLIAAVMLPGIRAQTDAVPHQHSHPTANAPSPPQSVAGLTIPDIELLNQHGEKVRFYSQLIQGKVVAINTIFTTCTTICPPMGISFSRLRKLLADHASQDVNLISITVDPEVDTPERLDKWSRQFGEMGPGWTLLTGSKADVDTLLKALRILTADKQEHQPVVLIGGDQGGDWVRASALLPPARLAELIRTRLDRVAPH